MAPTNDWREDAACLGLDTEDFFPKPGELEKTETARRVCNHCPVQANCLTFALTSPEYHGIWGGQTAYQRLRPPETRDQRRRLSKATRRRVVGLLEAGWSDSSIAREVGVSARTVYRVRKNLGIAPFPARERATA